MTSSEQAVAWMCRCGAVLRVHPNAARLKQWCDRQCPARPQRNYYNAGKQREYRAAKRARKADI